MENSNKNIQTEKSTEDRNETHQDILPIIALPFKISRIESTKKRQLTTQLKGSEEYIKQKKPSICFLNQIVAVNWTLRSWILRGYQLKLKIKIFHDFYPEAREVRKICSRFSTNLQQMLGKQYTKQQTGQWLEFSTIY